MIAIAAVAGSRRPCAHVPYTCSFTLRLLGYVVIKVAGWLHDDNDDDCYLSMCYAYILLQESI